MVQCILEGRQNCTQTLRADNRLLRSLSHQPPQLYFCSAATGILYYFSAHKLHPIRVVSIIGTWVLITRAEDTKQMISFLCRPQKRITGTQQQQLLLLLTGQVLWVCLALCICGEVNNYSEKQCHAVALACRVLYSLKPLTIAAETIECSLVEHTVNAIIHTMVVITITRLRVIFLNVCTIWLWISMCMSEWQTTRLKNTTLFKACLVKSCEVCREISMYMPEETRHPKNTTLFKMLCVNKISKVFPRGIILWQVWTTALYYVLHACLESRKEEEQRRSAILYLTPKYHTCA